jgi:hypothetical protein
MTRYTHVRTQTHKEQLSRKFPIIQTNTVILCTLITFIHEINDILTFTDRLNLNHLRDWHGMRLIPTGKRQAG